MESNAYLEARREWDERYADLVLGKRNWHIAAAGSIAVSLILAFGIVHQETPDQVTIENNHGIYLSPQQAKALWNMLGQNLAQYEQAFGKIALEPQGSPLPIPAGPIH